jgi:hypothetical protein
MQNVCRENSWLGLTTVPGCHLGDMSGGGGTGTSTSAAGRHCAGAARPRDIAMTLDTYGHLFLGGDDGKELAEAELRLIG